MIGAEPNTEWLNGCLDLDDRGFVVTGHDASGRELGSPFATTAAGIFAVGDVRSGSVKRVPGVGEDRSSCTRSRFLNAVPGRLIALRHTTYADPSGEIKWTDDAVVRR